jgi:microcin C transport system substrate-binding protein
MTVGRTFLRSMLVVAAFAGGVQAAFADEWRTTSSLIGESKYGDNFQRYDYVNPDAPKGGPFSLIGWGGVTTFNSLNGFILKGDAAQGLELLFDSLMVRAEDEPDAVYGLVAQEAEVADDGLSATFYLRPEAQFADGGLLTASDVVFTFNTLKEKGHPVIRQTLRDVVKAEAIDPHTVKYAFQGELTRDLPLTVAQLPIFSKAYYSNREFDQSTLDPPVGSGPYTVSDVKQGRSLTYKRNPAYWGRDLPVNRGRWNFGEIRFEYFRDRTAAMEAFKAGAYDFREEFTAKVWATEYGFPGVKDGRVKLETLPDATPSGTQGFFMNTRREHLKDRRVREALGLVFDYEWANKNLFHGLYTRTQSYFENSPMKAEGAPSDEERALLEGLGRPVDPAALGPAILPPVTDGSGVDRENLRVAGKLLDEAGWRIRVFEIEDPECGFVCEAMIAVGLSSARTERVRTNDAGERLRVEFLNFEPNFERVIAPYVRNLQLLGVEARQRMVDPAQYQQRVKDYDFDLTTERYVMGNTPGVGLRAFFGSDAAASPGSLNIAGISDPAIDALIEKVIGAKSREELHVAAKSLDRVLRAGHYWTPHWFKASHNIAYWDRFARPKVKPLYDRGILDTWWRKDLEAAKLGGAAQ